MPDPATENPTNRDAALARIREEVGRRRRFLITSHARPDGDSIGSQLAMAYALRALGKQVRIVNRDAAPAHYGAFPGVDAIEVADRVDGEFDAVFVMECSDVSRPEVAGIERYFLINVDHHAGNKLYGAVNWYDGTAAACGEMVYDIIEALGVPLTREIAIHIYLAILTDTGSFHHSNITPRTFEICRRAVQAGVDAAAMARSVFDSNSFGKLKLIGSLLDSMELDASGRLVVLHLDDRMLQAAGCTYNDTEGLINLPLTARDVQAVVFFKVLDGQVRVSLRSKGAIDVRSVALVYGGGGHRNAAGFTVDGRYPDLKREIVGGVARAVDEAG
jgi:phosphoesterase RecJ-like protein